MATFTTTNANNNTTKNSYFAVTTTLVRTVMSIALLSLLFNLTSCNPDAEMIVPEGAVETNYTSSPRVTSIVDSNNTLKAVASFPIGAAFSSNIIANSAKAHDLFLNQFNSKTIYTFMRIEPTQGKFNFKELDYWVKLSQTNPMRLHGHCLVYQNGTPDWLTNFSGSTSEFESAIKNHIQTIVGRYKGKVQGWDVINEVFDNSGAIMPTVFRKFYPNDAAYMAFVKRCFQWAHASDPDAMLFYSDFGVEVSKAKLKTVINVINDFKQSGVPINGFSPHMHISIYTSDARINDCLQQLSATGLQIHISELDIKINPENNQNVVFSNQLLNVQREKYRTIAIAYNQIIPKKQQYGITLWDFSDGDSWIAKKSHDAPCVLDATYNKKPAFYGLMQGLMD